MRQTKGSIMYDGWTHNNTHFVAIYGCYMRKIVDCGFAAQSKDAELCVNLLSVSPMAKFRDPNSRNETDVDGDDVEETTVFNAQTQVNHFEEVFKEFYDVDIRDWAICQTADDVAVNKKIARILGIPHIGCKNYLLALQVSKMVNNNPELQSAIQSVHKTMQ